MTSLADHIGTVLRLRRVAKGLSGPALSKQLGRGRNHVLNWESGRGPTQTFDDLQKMLDALDLELVIRPKDHADARGLIAPRADKESTGDIT
jgi:transcriptional regulator with XRE-family HTH domain